MLALLLGGIVAGTAAVADVVLSEFMASNLKTARDETGRFEDWIELRNLSSNSVNLHGWSLSGNPKKPRQWLFPATNLPPGAHLLIWASGRNRREPGAPLHTNFRLASAGEYLGLFRPDGSPATVFEPAYPPQLPDVSLGFLPGTAQAVFFVAPTPGQPNETTGKLPGPVLSDLAHAPQAPSTNEAVVVTVRAAALLAPVTNVTLHWRVMFEETRRTEMNDLGKNGDRRARDGVWTATIPTGAAGPGQMLRWRVTASDAQGRVSAWPLFPDPLGTEQYHGTVAQAGYATSALPVFHLFIEPRQMGGADSEGGARACFFYDGEFYDNLFIKVRGNTTAGFPKKSHRLEFPREHPLRHPGPGGRIRHTSLMAEYGDPTYLRQHLSFWLLNEAGAVAPFHYPVRVQLNGAFWQLAMHSEVLGEELLDRHGLDPEGALYKAVGVLTPDGSGSGGFEKKTRRFEGRDDYVALARALGESHRGRSTNVFDRLNLPAVINYLAIARLTQEDDDIWANLSLYHDPRADEWRPVAFDMNVSWGFSFCHSGIQATEDNVRSHPFFGASNVGQNQGFNRLYDAIIATPDTRAMLLRRMRSVMDRWWQPPGTPPEQRIIERHIASMTNVMWADAITDRRKWGGFGPPETALSRGVKDLVERFIEPRRRHFYVTHSLNNTNRPIGLTSRHNAGIPDSQPAVVPMRFGNSGLGPEPAQDWLTLTNPNPIAVDLSGWKLEGVTFTFAPGTVLPAGGVLYVSPDVAAFRRRETSPRGGEGRFVVGDYRGRLGKVAALTLKDEHGRVRDTRSLRPAPKL